MIRMHRSQARQTRVPLSSLRTLHTRTLAQRLPRTKDLRPRKCPSGRSAAATLWVFETDQKRPSLAYSDWILYATCLRLCRRYRSRWTVEAANRILSVCVRASERRTERWGFCMPVTGLQRACRNSSRCCCCCCCIPVLAAPLPLSLSLALPSELLCPPSHFFGPPLFSSLDPLHHPPLPPSISLPVSVSRRGCGDISIHPSTRSCSPFALHSSLSGSSFTFLLATFFSSASSHLSASISSLFSIHAPHSIANHPNFISIHPAASSSDRCGDLTPLPQTAPSFTSASIDGAGFPPAVPRIRSGLTQVDTSARSISAALAQTAPLLLVKTGPTRPFPPLTQAAGSIPLTTKSRFLCLSIPTQST